MGQQETMRVTGSSAVRRIIMVLTVAALMALMLASAMPAMAKNTIQTGLDQPPGPPRESFGPAKNGSSSTFHTSDGTRVAHSGKNGGKRTGGGC